MLVSRVTNLLKIGRLLKNKPEQFQQIIRNSSHNWHYRTLGKDNPKYLYTTAEVVAGVFWWWILWHMYTEPGHIFGEFEYPIASKWTNAELGIPEDDEE